MGHLEGLRLTKCSSIKTDPVNAEAVWVNEEILAKKGLVASRTPADIPTFCKKIIEDFLKVKHYGLPRAEGFSATL